MKIVFMGTPQFAVPSLQRLQAEHDIAAVITAPDKPAGRGKKLRASAIKHAAEELGLDVWQPTNLKDEQFRRNLKGLNADLFVVVAFRMLPDQVWQIPPKGTINLHASLLPQYRGAAPINRAIMNGEKTTGLTTFYIRREIDTGGIIDRRKMQVGPDETAGELHDRMMNEGADLLSTTLSSIAKGDVNSIPQEDLTKGSTIPTAPKIFKEDRRIDWKRPAQEIHNQIRGLSPYPGAFADTVAGMEVKILRSALTASSTHSVESPGKLRIEEDKLFVQTGSHPLEILELQIPGKKPLPTREVLHGLRDWGELEFSVVD